MTLLNRVLGILTDGLLYPFRGLPPWVGVAVVSLVTAAGMLLVFKATSNQERMVAVKRQIHAGFFEIRLLNDDLVAILKSQAGILRHNLSYLRLSLVPLLWMIVPLVLLIAQLQAYYGYRPLEPGDRALVTVQLAEGWEQTESATRSSRPAVEIIAPAGLEVETASVWLPSLREVAWRIAADRAGAYAVTVKVGEETFTKQVDVSQGPGRRSPFRHAPGLLNQILYPAEPPLPASSPVRSITVEYEDAEIAFPGIGIHWLIAFFVLSIVFAFALRGRFGVTI